MNDVETIQGARGWRECSCEPYRKVCQYHEGWFDGYEAAQRGAAREAEVMSTEEPLPVIDASCDCDKCVSRTTHFYEVRGWCSNCGARFIVRCRKGDKTPLSVECPNCECSAYMWSI